MSWRGEKFARVDVLEQGEANKESDLWFEGIVWFELLVY